MSKIVLQLILLIFLSSSYTIAQTSIDKYINGIVTYTVIGDGADGVKYPRDLDFQPGTSDLWVVNKGGTLTTSDKGSWVLFKNAMQSNPLAVVKTDGSAEHFFNTPAAISFSTNGNFATIGELINSPGDTKEFMGPVLWQANIVGDRPTDGSVHIDMIHQSPYGMGVENEKYNIFWVFDGMHSTICRYDYHTPHPPGEYNHDDGEIAVYSEIKVLRKPGVPSHMVRDKASNFLYIVDTGNKRIIRVDATSGIKGASMTPQNEPLDNGYYNMKNVVFNTIIDTGLEEPSGIDYTKDRLIVSDHKNGDIIIYNTSVSPVAEMGRIKTGSPGIMGVKIGPDGKIWYVNMIDNIVRRIEPSVISGSNKALENTSVNIFPNPSEGIFDIEFTLSNISKVDIEIYDMKGNAIKSIQQNGEIGNNNLRIDLTQNNLIKGLYFLKIMAGDGVIVRKFTIK